MSMPPAGSSVVVQLCSYVHAGNQTRKIGSLFVEQLHLVLELADISAVKESTNPC
jgi:hypothetical protein